MLLYDLATVLIVVKSLLLDLPDAASAEELARYLDLKKLDERVYIFEAVSAYDGN
ncbi:ADP-ribosylation factor-related protein [Salix suchowensis]|nr:ADP-ribosylation factor-related protein [Salix suchowensis]